MTAHQKSCNLFDFEDAVKRWNRYIDIARKDMKLPEFVGMRGKKNVADLY